MNGFEKVFEKIGHVVAYPFVHAATVVEFLGTALKDEPEVKTAVVGLVKQIEVLTADGAVSVAAGGVNLPDDLATVAAAQTLFAYIKGTFVPQIEAAFKDFQLDAAGITADPAPEPVPNPGPVPESADPAPAAAETVAQSGPGLHNVVAA